MVKGEIAHYEQFLLSHSVFKGLVLHKCKDKGLFGKWLQNREFMVAFTRRQNHTLNI